MRGQASIEYVVVVALVVVVTAVATTIAAPGIANDVGRAFRRALCVVGGGDCLATERQPCVTASSERSEGVAVEGVLFRIGNRSAILRKARSDGIVEVTLIDDLSSGVGAAVGIEGRFEVGGVDLAGGGMLQASALARLGTTRTFRVRGGKAADRLIAELMDGSGGSTLLASAKRLVDKVLPGGDDGPRPDLHTFGAGAETEVSAALRLPFGSELSTGLKASVGGTMERKTGRRTLFFDVGGSAAGALKALVAAGSVEGDASAGLAVTYARDGRPLLLTASLTGAARAGAEALDSIPGVPRPQGEAARKVEVEASLDLERSDNAALARQLIGALDPRHPRPLVAAAATREIGARLVREGDVDVRYYDASSSSHGIGAKAGLIAKLGAEVDVTRSSSRLRAAWSRPTGGVWERRIDCA